MNTFAPQAVKPRLLAGGDGWANQHRTALPNDFYLSDIDAALALDTEDKIFLGYVPDSWGNRHAPDRKFALVALFDRVRDEATAWRNSHSLASQLYRWLARTISEQQPYPVRFFYVCGDDSPPWEMIEVDIFSGQPTGFRCTLEAGDWRECWQAAGLYDLRRELAHALA